MLFCWSTGYSIYTLDMFVLVIENPGGKISNYNMYVHCTVYNRYLFSQQWGKKVKIQIIIENIQHFQLIEQTIFEKPL